MVVEPQPKGYEMNTNRSFPDQQSKVSEMMRIARIFDGHYCLNTATSVTRLYVPESRRARVLRWLLAR